MAEIVTAVGPFVAHLFGDFVLQNEWMATRKKDSSRACFAHVVVYMVPFLVCGLTWWQLLLIAAQHFAQDRTGFVFWWLRTWKKVPQEYWMSIGVFVDQAFHAAWIAVVLFAVGPLLARLVVHP